MRIPKCLAVNLCGPAFPPERLGIPPGSRNGGSGKWVVYCVLIQHLKNDSDNELHSVVPEFWP